MKPFFLQVVDLISQAIGDFMQAEFLGEHDKQGNPVPVKGMSLASWEEKNCLAAGSLLANSCKSTVELAGFDEALQAKAHEFGKNVALAWEVNKTINDLMTCIVRVVSV